MEEWLAEDWEDVPPVTMEEVERKLLEMHALAAPGPDGIMAQCLQALKTVLVPCLAELFQWMLQLGVPPRLVEDGPSPSGPKTGGRLACSKGATDRLPY